MRNTENLDGGQGVASNDTANSNGATNAVAHRKARNKAFLALAIIATTSPLCCLEYVIHANAAASTKAIKAIIQSLIILTNASIFVR